MEDDMMHKECDGECVSVTTPCNGVCPDTTFLCGDECVPLSNTSLTSCQGDCQPASQPCHGSVCQDWFSVVMSARLSTGCVVITVYLSPHLAMVPVCQATTCRMVSVWILPACVLAKSACLPVT